VETLRLRRAVVLAWVVLSTLSFVATPARAAQELRPVNFSSFSVPFEITVAREQGIFARNGIELVASQVPNSTSQLQDLLDQETGIATTSADNIVYWVEDRDADFLILMSGASPLDQNLYVRPEIQSFDDLRGTVLAVDSASSGYATVMRAILQRNGLAVGRDVELEEVGNTGARTQALVNGSVAGSMLGEGQTAFIRQAEEAGVHVLARGADYMPEYPASTYVTTRRWAADNPQLVVAFLRSIAEARAWLRDPANTEEAVALIVRTNNAGDEVARRVYRDALADIGAPTVQSQVQTSPMQAIVDMRIETGLMPAPAPDVSKYITPNWYLLTQSARGQ
jgi:NitT/TauT family transport system substrate-binding protein